MDTETRKLVTLVAAGLGAVVGVAALARRVREYPLAGKSVLITGGSRGLGLALAREFGRAGARLAICARDGDELERAEADLSARGYPVFPALCDVTSRDQVERTVAAVEERFGAVDVLVNNAGMIQVGPMEVQTLEDYEAAMDVHFWGPLYAIRAALPGMLARRQGRIMNVSSIGGKIAVPHMLPYSASKFALVGLSEGLRAELAKDGIAVTTVCPGLMRTGGHRNAMFKGQNEAEYAWFTIGDSLPGATVSAENAARQIVAACRRGDAELVIGLPAALVVAFHGAFPGLTADLMSVMNRMLPGPGGIGTEQRKGAESETPLTRSWLTALSRRAAAAHNENG